MTAKTTCFRRFLSVECLTNSSGNCITVSKGKAEKRRRRAFTRLELEFYYNKEEEIFI